MPSRDEEPIRVMILDDSEQKADLMELLLKRPSQDPAVRKFQVVSVQWTKKGAADSIRELEERDELPDVVLVDYELRPEKGPEVVKYLRDMGLDQSGMQFIAHSVRLDQKAVIDHFEEVGITSFLDRHVNGATIKFALQTVAEGGSYISPSVDCLVQEEGRLPKLSSDELAVARLWAVDALAKVIAGKLNLTEDKVNNLKRSIRSKLGIKGPGELNRWLSQNGLL